MCSLNLVPSLTTLAAMAALGFALQTAQAGEKEYVPKAKVTPLTQTALTGVENREVIIKRFDIPPGFVGGRHSHTGPVFVYVAEGELTVDVDGQGRQVIRAGEIYQEPMLRVMQGRNLSANSPLTLIVFQVGEPGKPMMIKAE